MSEACLYLVYEPEAACRQRLLADGFAARHADEIASYLAQSTDIQADLAALERACANRGFTFRPVALDDAATVLAAADPAASLVWTLSDGIAYFRGGAAPALARLHGLPTFGADDALFALCQDKFRSCAVLQALGLPVPPAGLARDGAWIVDPPRSSSGYFVKPNRLGAKIGIYPDSRCGDPDAALAISRRVWDAYRDAVVVQPYVAGRNARASFLAVDGASDVARLGVAFVDSGGDFQTMENSLALYGETGAAARASGLYSQPALRAVAETQPAADRQVRALAAQMADGLGLRDVFSIDLRIDADDTIHLIEFEVCPGLPCFDFRDYCRTEWALPLAEAMASAAAAKLAAVTPWRDRPVSSPRR